MTVDNYFTRETDTFVHTNAKYYPEKIPILHWQLRHFISNPEPDIIHYASSRDIFSLNVATGVRTHITCLPFWARCTSSGFGFICAGGGDGGHFAIVKLEEPEDSTSTGERIRTRRHPSVRVEQAGTEIVNSISIHQLEGDEEARTQDDVVAVLTNNDKTIRIFSLTQHTQNTVLELPFPANHATISPDGRTLVAVGDYQQAYFYDRVDLAPSIDSKAQKPVSAQCMWELLNIVALHVPSSVHTTGYFTTAWSPSGNLCAVGSECGYVSVIDIGAMQRLDAAEDAIVIVTPSTRPEVVHPSSAIPGAIRTILFAPHPWDLLIWAEDQGRICVADLRSGLRVKQILRLDPEQESIRKVEMEISTLDAYSRFDREVERENGRHLRTGSIPDSEGLDMDDNLAMAEARRVAEGRRMARAALVLAEDRSQERDLSAQEREILDALRTTSQNEESSNRNSVPRSIHYSELAAESRRSTAQQSSLFAQDFPALARQSQEATSASTSTLPTTFRILRDYMRDQAIENATPTQPGHSPESRLLHYTPRRQSSIFVSSRDPPMDDAETQQTRVERETTAIPTSYDRAPPASSERASATRLLNTLRASPNPEESNAAAELRRRRARYRAPDARNYHRIGVGPGLSTRGDYYDPSLGLRTAGLAVSRDGRRLWAACDRGIFEWEINVRDRMGLKAVELK